MTLSSTNMLLLIVWSLVLGDSFEGEVVYVNTYEVYDKKLSADSLSGTLGDTTILLIKKSNYKLSTNGRKRVTAVYEGEKNVWYVYQNRLDTILAVGGSARTMKSVVFESPRETNEEVLGLPCRSVAMNWNQGRNIYYFNEKLSIDPELFAGHNIDEWNQYCRISQALPLMIRYEKKGYTRIQRAIKITPRRVLDAELGIPKDRPVIWIR